MLRTLACLSMLLALNAQARPLFVDGFDPPRIEPQFPLVAGAYQLPPGPASTQLQWLIGELAAGETTTLAEVNDHFDATWLAQTPAAQTQAFIASVRASYPDARIVDVIALTPVRATVLIDTPGSGAPYGFLSFGTRFAGAGRIVLFGVSGFSGSVQYPADQNLTLAQAVARFATLSSAPSLLVGRIDRHSGQCSLIAGHEPDTLRATASIFKTWVLGGVGRAIARNHLASTNAVPLVASELAPGGVISGEPLGTPFTVRDLAVLMMGISDNTATDLLHEVVGRDVVEQVVLDFGVAQPQRLTPFLNISEQFHVFRSFDLPTALSYVNGSEDFQRRFLLQQIEPLGPQTTSPFFHPQLLTSGTWQASAFDVCRAFAALRRLPQGSEALQTVDAAFGAGVAQPDVREHWDRVWYKGGSLARATDDFDVLSHAWMLENAGEDPFVVVALSNSAGGGIDPFQVQSVTGRLLALVRQMP